MHIQAQGLAEAIARMKKRSERVQALQPALEVFGADIVKRTDDAFMNQMDWDGKAFAPLADSTLAARAGQHAAGVGGIRSKRTALRAKLRASGKRPKDIRKALKNLSNSYQLKRMEFAVGLSPREKAAALLRLRQAYVRSNTQLRTQGLGRPELARALRTSRATYKRKRSKIGSAASVKILIDTARARNSNHVDRLTRTSIDWSAVGYLAYHMTGTRRMPERNPSPFVYAASEWALHPTAGQLLDAYLTSYIVRGEANKDSTGHGGQSGGGAA